MNTEMKDNILLELDQIKKLYWDIRSVESELSSLKVWARSHRDKERDRLRSPIEERLKTFKEEQLKQLPRFYVGYNVSSVPCVVPSHWRFANSRPELLREKRLESCFSPKWKEQFYNSFREHEKNLVKIKEMGTVMTNTQISTGEMVSIMISEPTTVMLLAQTASTSLESEALSVSIS